MVVEIKREDKSTIIKETYQHGDIKKNAHAQAELKATIEAYSCATNEIIIGGDFNAQHDRRYNIDRKFVQFLDETRLERLNFTNHTFVGPVGWSKIDQILIQQDALSRPKINHFGIEIKLSYKDYWIKPDLPNTGLTVKRLSIVLKT